MAEMELQRIDQKGCVFTGFYQLGNRKVGRRWQVKLVPICEKGGFLFFSGDCETRDPDPGKPPADWISWTYTYLDEESTPDDLYTFCVNEVTRTRVDDCQRVTFEWGYYKRKAASPVPIYKAKGVFGGPLGIKADGTVAEVFDQSGQFIVRMCCRENEEGECEASCELVDQIPAPLQPQPQGN